MAEERKKEKSQGFAAFGIPVGSTLVFKKNPEITVKTLDDKNKVEYEGKPYSISTIAKQLVGYPVSGYLYFKFEGKILKSPAKIEAKAAESPVPTPAPAEESSEPLEAPEISEEASKEEALGDSIPDIDPLAGFPAEAPATGSGGEESGE